MLFPKIFGLSNSTCARVWIHMGKNRKGPKGYSGIKMSYTLPNITNRTPKYLQFCNTFLENAGFPIVNIYKIIKTSFKINNV